MRPEVTAIFEDLALYFMAVGLTDICLPASALMYKRLTNAGVQDVVWKRGFCICGQKAVRHYWVVAEGEVIDLMNFIWANQNTISDILPEGVTRLDKDSSMEQCDDPLGFVAQNGEVYALFDAIVH